MNDDIDLLRRYAINRDETAFAELVRRNLPLVYSTALRRLSGDTHRAQDVAQVVFCSLARGARRIARGSVLGGWLYTATRNAVIDVVRAEKRRRVRETEAHTMHEIEAITDAPADWSELRPVLDDAMDQLRQPDREAIILRFFQGRTFIEIGSSLGLNEDTARKRVERALDKLRHTLQERGLVSTSAALATLLANQTIAATPATLFANITGAALATGAVTSAGVTAFVALTKVEVALAAAVIVGGTTGLITQQRSLATLRQRHAVAEQQVAKLSAENQILATNHAEIGAQLSRVRAEMAALQPPAGPAEAPTTRAAVPGTPRTEAGASALSPLPRLPQTSDIDQQKAALHRRYDPFLQARGLTPEQGDRFVELLIHQAIARQDLQASVETKGLRGDTPGIEALRSKLYAPITRELHELLGGEGYNAYTAYSSASFYREGFLTPLVRQFTAAALPLSPQQADGLVRVIAANDHPERMHATDIGTVARIDWQAVAAGSRDILTPPQLAVLQSYADHQSSPRR